MNLKVAMALSCSVAIVSALVLAIVYVEAVRNQRGMSHFLLCWAMVADSV